MTKTGFGLVDKARDELVKRFLARKVGEAGDDSQAVAGGDTPTSNLWGNVSEVHYRFDRFPGYEKMLMQVSLAKRAGIANPFFKTHDSVADANTVIDGRVFSNFSSYNYLGLVGHPRVNKAAKEAIDRYGTSTSASRLVAGERPIQRQLERALADVYDVEDCVVFVSGHATNVTTIACLFGRKDLILHDNLVHNSVMEGIKLSGATRRVVPHNDTAALEGILSEIRGQFERVLIVVEGVYSMDGDIPDLPRLIEIKTRHKAFLMVDEAHSLGVVGATGRGVREHYGVAGTAVDIWMGTLSKSLAGCGGYICGEKALIEQLKYGAAGFVYSVGLSPPLAAASLEALRIMLEEPSRVVRLKERTDYFLETAKVAGLNTGHAQGFAVVPAIVGSSLKATRLSNKLFEMGMNVQPIIHPAVEERAARLRFFLSSTHSEKSIDAVIQAVAAHL